VFDQFGCFISFLISRCAYIIYGALINVVPRLTFAMWLHDAPLYRLGAIRGKEWIRLWLCNLSSNHYKIKHSLSILSDALTLVWEESKICTEKNGSGFHHAQIAYNRIGSLNQQVSMLRHRWVWGYCFTRSKSKDGSQAGCHYAHIHTHTCSARESSRFHGLYFYVGPCVLSLYVWVFVAICLIGQ
jgi:hypothetical protein